MRVTTTTTSFFPVRLELAGEFRDVAGLTASIGRPTKLNLAEDGRFQTGRGISVSESVALVGYLRSPWCSSLDWALLKAFFRA